MPSGPKKRRAAKNKTSTNPEEKNEAAAVEAGPEMAVENTQKESQTLDQKTTESPAIDCSLDNMEISNEDQSHLESPLMDPGTKSANTSETGSFDQPTMVNWEDSGLQGFISANLPEKTLLPLIKPDDQPVCEENLDIPTKELEESLKDVNKGCVDEIEESDKNKEVGQVEMLLEQLVLISSEINNAEKHLALATKLSQSLCQVLEELKGSKPI